MSADRERGRLADEAIELLMSGGLSELHRRLDTPEAKEARDEALRSLRIEELPETPRKRGARLLAMGLGLAGALAAAALVALLSLRPEPARMQSVLVDEFGRKLGAQRGAAELGRELFLQLRLDDPRHLRIDFYDPAGERHSLELEEGVESRRFDAGKHELGPYELDAFRALAPFCDARFDYFVLAFREAATRDELDRVLQPRLSSGDASARSRAIDSTLATLRELRGALVDHHVLNLDPQ